MAMERFFGYMDPYLRNLWPRHARLLGHNGIKSVLRLGADNARAFGLSNPGLLGTYIELMFLLGSHFDSDPWVPWAGQILRDPAIDAPLTRAQRLYEHMNWFRDNVTGSDREFEHQALSERHNLFRDDVPPGDPRFSSAWMTAIYQVHPRRAAILGDARLGTLLSVATEAALQNGVGTPRGVCLWAFLMLTRGHKFAVDPLMPWTKEALAERAGETLSQRAERFEAAFERYRAHVLGPVAR
jgi:hypothetical protein